MQVGSLFQSSFGGRHVTFTGLIFGAGRGFADLEFSVGVGLVGIGQSADKGFVRVFLGTGGFGRVDTSIFINVDCEMLEFFIHFSFHFFFGPFDVKRGRVRFSMSHGESLTGRFRDSKLRSGRSQFFSLVSHLSMIISMEEE